MCFNDFFYQKKNPFLAEINQKINTKNLLDNRRRLCQLIFTTSNLNQHLSGIIINDETFRQVIIFKF